MSILSFMLAFLATANLNQTVIVAPQVDVPVDFSTEFHFSTAGKTSIEQVLLHIVPVEFPIVEWLTELTPLRKIHYSWALSTEFLADKPLLFQFVRLTHGCSLTARWALQEDMNDCVEVCGQVNDTNPAKLAAIALNYSPYHYFYNANDSPLGLEDQYQAELDMANQKFASMKTMLAEANTTYNSNITVEAILLDSERLKYKPETDPEAPEWNAAITEKYQAIQTIVETHFPGIRIEWYGRGQWTPCPVDSGWCLNSHHPTDFSSPGYSANLVLYWVGNFRVVQEQFKRTVEYAATYGVTVVNPWIAIGSGYSSSKGKEVKTGWTNNWNYELVNSWKLGGNIDNPWYGNRPERFAPWHAAEIVMFYPEPGKGRTRDWGRHFVSYVRGAHNIKTLP